MHNEFDPFNDDDYYNDYEPGGKYGFIGLIITVAVIALLIWLTP
jgi:hypothetical protein